MFQFMIFIGLFYFFLEKMQVARNIYHLPNAFPLKILLI
jgi:hypothetical protein